VRRAGRLAALAGVLVGLAAAAAVNAAAAGAASYADSVDQALGILRSASADDRGAALRAADVLESGTGQSQREILVELRQDPPAVADATARLAALSRADRSPAFAPEPGKAQRAIDDILAQPRYADLRQGPSLEDRIRDALLWVLDQVLGGVGAVLGTAIGLAVAAGAAAIGLLVAGLVVVRSSRWRGRRDRPELAVARLRARADRFADADRLAAAGDLAAAVRALAGAVAVALGDEGAWEASPLTVRELFSRAPDPGALRPLLLAFETAAYADRPPDADVYRRAEAAAAPLRPDRMAA
jgi:hypothetical protein